MTERREINAKLMQMDRMIAVGTLSAGVAHEINNPLSCVHVNLEFLLRRILSGEGSIDREELEADEVWELLMDSLEGTQRIRDIVSDLRTFSTTEDMVEEPVSIEDILDKAIKIASNQIRHRCWLVRDYCELPTVISDESRLAQVFLNILINAAQVIPEGDADNNQITVQTRLEEDKVVVEIIDTGVGIAEEKISRIFDPFVTSKSQEMGMGLGLSICQNTVQRLKGEIQVESKLGEGSTFRVVLSAKRTDQSSAEFDVPEVSAHPGEQVIVIDDEPMLLRAIKRQLGDGYDVETFDSGEEALHYLSTHPTPRAILCDLQMPRFSGAELYRRLQEEHESCMEVLVFMTGGRLRRICGAFWRRTPSRC